jgi:dihydrofolate synthase/folylpolyglutamate synthase
VLGEDLVPEALAVARAVAAQREARIIAAPTLPAAIELRAHGGFQRHNLALARAAAEAYLQGVGIAWQEGALGRVAESLEVPGRLQRLEGDPPTILDGAHNPHAVRALVASLPAQLAGKRVALVLGVLEDKDAAAMLAELLRVSERAWFTAPPSARALSPAALQSLARQQGFERTTCEPSPERALAQAREWARENDAVVLVTGSVYLVGEVLALAARARRGEGAER